MQPRAGHLFVLNNIFKIKDTTRAFRRRWIIIDFEKEVENADRFKVEQVLDEVPAIVSWAIDGLRDLLANDYAVPKSSELAVDEWLGECDTVWQYEEARLVRLTADEKANDAIKWPMGDAIYEDYQSWVKKNGHGSPMSSTRFFRRLGEHLGLRTGKGTKEGHTVEGNTYPVRFREFAEMMKRAKDDELRNAHIFSEGGPPSQTPDEWRAASIPVGDRLALVVQARTDGKVALEIPGVGHAWYSASVTGVEAMQSFLASVTDSGQRTVVTLVRVVEDGQTVGRIVQLRKLDEPTN